MKDFSQKQELPIDKTNKNFCLALDFVEETSQHLFLTGKAGTGKTTFLKYLRQHGQKQTLVAAPTGVAAINAGGVTVHSLFQLAFEPFIPGGGLKSKPRFSKPKLDLLRQAELLIIDEVSMLRADMLDAIDTTLRTIRRNQKPFGGIQMLYIGDMFQLPPVVKDEEWTILKEYYPSPFFFHAHVLRRCPPVYLELKKIYRQKEQIFIDLLNNIRNNELSALDVDRLNQRYIPDFKPSEKEKYIILTTHNYQADKINAEKLADLKSPSFKFEGTVSGEFPEYALPTDLVLELKTGTQVMFIKNDPGQERRYYNGKIGEVVEVNEKTIVVQLAESELKIKVDKEEWKNIRYELDKEKNEIKEEVLGTFSQYPLRLAWAITIHKSQGLTFDHAIIDTANAFAAGQTYVALSRCTSLDGIVLQSPFLPQCVQTNPHAIAFSQTEKNQDELQEDFHEAKRLANIEQLLRYFDWAPLLSLLYDYKRLTEDKISDDLQSAHILSEKLYSKALEQKTVAEKFQIQLQKIIQNSHLQENEISLLKDRCQKAVLYFYEDMRTEILLPLQQHKAGFQKQKKAKAYWKTLNSLEEDIVSFVLRLTKVKYNQMELAPNLELASLKNNEIFQEEPSGKKPKGHSHRLSLDLFLSGKSIKEIAEERNLSSSTVEGHLFSFIEKGEIGLEELISEDKIQKINSFLNTTENSDDTPIGTLKLQMGEEFSYAEIKAVIQKRKQQMN